MIIRKTERRLRAAMTLVEVMVSVGLGSLVLAGIAGFMMFSAQSFAATANYAELEKASRNAVDTISAAVRETQGFSSYSSNRVELIDTDGQPLILNYSAEEETLFMTRQGKTTALLTHCTDCRFDGKQRNPQANKWDQFDITGGNLATFKVLKMGWVVSREIHGTTLLNTEVIQTTRIVIRAN